MRTEMVFQLHMTCSNCLRPSVRDVVIPPVDDAPYDVDSFLESGLARSLQFHCGHCDSAIARLVAVTIDRERSPATPEQEMLSWAS